MKKMEEIEITIDPEGRVSLLVKGVKGKMCTELTSDLEDAVGHVESRQWTSEYYRKDAAPVVRKGIVKSRA